MDVVGFAAWYEECHARTVAGLWALTADEALAEDCTAEAFALALARWPHVRNMEHPRRWLQTVALNVMRRTLRRRRIERVLLARGRPVVVPEPEPAGDVWPAVRRLPRRQRIAVTLRYAADLTEADIAEVMGVTHGTVASTLFDARRVLAETLSDLPVVNHG
jgi:DNA-directed RNA polymerase specialized sigma24 family protein